MQSPGCLTPRIETRHLCVGGWMAAENLPATGIQSLERPAHSESLHRLRYPGPVFHWGLQ